MTNRRSISRWRDIRPHRTRIGFVRNADTFGYNDRSEVTEATIGGIASAYSYDEIGNVNNSIVDEALMSADETYRYSKRRLAVMRAAYPRSPFPIQPR